MLNQKNSIALVILNYKTPNDTIALLKNIQKQIWYKNIKIYIVDNNSEDESIKKIKKLNFHTNVELIESKVNLGFANGNNLGIKKALSDGFKFIMVSNSDIFIEKQNNFIKTLYKIYEKDNNIAVIAPSIKNLDNIYQNPFRRERFSKKEIIKFKLFYLSGFYKLYYFFRIYFFYKIITYMAKRKKLQTRVILPIQPPESGYIYAPHGSFLIFTPTFFKYFDGFDDKTFLFCEEFILAEKLRQNNLKCWYENSLNIIHKESRSTEKITNNYKEKVKFTLKHTFNSCKYFAKIIKIESKL